MLRQEQLMLFDMGEPEPPQLGGPELRLQLDAGPLALLRVIYEHLDSEGKARLPLKQLGEVSGLRQGPLRDALRDLERGSLIVITHRVGKRLMNTYIVTENGLAILGGTRVRPQSERAILNAIAELKERKGQVQIAGTAIVHRMGGNA